MAEIRADKTAVVAELPRRIVQVTHALIVAGDTVGAWTPVTAAEVCVYDHTAMSVGSTREALSRALSRGLADRIGSKHWIPTNKAFELAAALEARVLAIEDADG